MNLVRTMLGAAMLFLVTGGAAAAPAPEQIASRTPCCRRPGRSPLPERPAPPAHRPRAQALRGRTRSFTGVGPRSKASRRRRSR